MKTARTACFLLAIALFLASAGPLPGASGLDSRIAQEEARMRILEKQISEHQKRAKQMGEKEKGVLTQLNSLDQKKKVTEQRIRVLELKLEKVKNTISNLRAEVRLTEQELAEMMHVFENRLVDIYKYGGVAEFNLLLSSTTAHEAMETSYLLNRIALQDQAMISGMLEKKDRLLQAAAQMEQQEKELAVNTSHLGKERKTFREEINKSNAFLGQVRQERALHEQAVKELQQSQKEIQQTVTALMRKKRDEESRDRGRSAQYTYLPSGGQLSWPVQGQISSTFGTRVHPVFKTKMMHTGIDIRAPRGTPVRAAGPGEVLFAGWLRGYGQVIIIDHGNNLSSVYAHLSSMSVRESAAVKKGQTIGSVGSTGTATGAHLHFEVRVGGDARDPMRYLRK
ncbi:murein DD-endopeptidase MepM/ murein hydrolase activator NlpD [Aminivibrio pyruvatiphilus]|uniref:Murein DD-endopeptidase MepM/ murein hydrolase activator NlpD n=1 Tax=Aminivibrio pyruvatiphilus TaxID=1005740 RepID=A0A4R8MJC7_9BACT|nr:M23 family metallopeptidase [Aminivibrio pyruvatiphilus]TDY65138.1 murein DD-endopeptidase MepM/ murein hydrolase activator NlpD [Aminivibrio pyruvatiphilus]